MDPKFVLKKERGNSTINFNFHILDFDIQRMVTLIGASFVRNCVVYINNKYLAIFIKIQSCYCGKVTMTLSQKEELKDGLDHLNKPSYIN